ncbi:DUF547 domain-containing protein [Psychroflexus sp. YR1-1]|uniref:DUF547 domain-containing protein n=1 Tax=Psychroflexus aurantiacus TaxID=2709310 RepID=A0A6B3R5Y1_9FLAO|nr:DUF547 domain-containing protein [Psychroflexus aurantiacus]NEV94465.1 DUF547 domain-containing protein [Psychroflexus aurantiacus]
MQIFRHLVLVISVFIGVFQLQAQDIHKHQQWDELLKMYVDDNGHVNYKALKKNQEDLIVYLNLLNENPPDQSWNRAQKKAYLINAYNAYTVKLIIDNYPLESIRDIGGFFNNPFTTEFAKIGGKTYALDDIEKGMLLKMGDPRVHFAVNCASESCPKLANEAYVASKLDQQLDAAAKRFILSDQNKLSKNHVELSKIFKWYASDFETDTTSVIDFINQYSGQKINEDASIEYLPYSWKLNEN